MKNCIQVRMIYLQQWWSLYFFTSCSSPTWAGGPHKRVDRSDSLHPLPGPLALSFPYSLNEWSKACLPMEGPWGSVTRSLPPSLMRTTPAPLQTRTQPPFSHAPTEHKSVPAMKKKSQSDRQGLRSPQSPSPAWSLSRCVSQHQGSWSRAGFLKSCPGGLMHCTV